MKIGRDSHSLSLIDRDSREAGVNRIENSGHFDVPDSVVNKLIRAEVVTIKIDFSNRPSIVWNVPQAVLNEWKQILR